MNYQESNKNTLVLIIFLFTENEKIQYAQSKEFLKITKNYKYFLTHRYLN